MSDASIPEDDMTTDGVDIPAPDNTEARCQAVEATSRRSHASHG